MSRDMNNDVEEVKSRINITDVVGDYVRLERAGAGQWKGLCPFHKEKSPSFTVSEERQLWHCFGCGKGGDLFSFVMEQEGMDFRDALTMLAERAGVTLTKQRGSADSTTADTKKKLYEILDLATRFYQKQLMDGIGTREARPYLTERGINEISMAEFRLGFAPDGWRHICDFLVGRKYTLKDICATGLIIQKDGTQGTQKNDYYDRFRGRVMFPIMDPMGHVVGFTARILPGDDDGKSAKYINTSDSPVYHKGNVLYGIAQAKQAIKEAGRTVVVEGNMDVIAAYQAGVRETIAVSGTALTENHARIMRRYAQQTVLFFDNDAAGQKAARKSAMICLAAGIAVRIVAPQEGAGFKDAADIARDNPEKLRTLIDSAESAMEIFFEQALGMYDITQPEGRCSVVASMAPLISAHTSRVDQEYWTERLAQRTQVSLTAITEMVNDVQSQEGRLSQRTPEVLAQEDVQIQKVPVESRSKERSDVLTSMVLSLVAQSSDAFMALMKQDFPARLLRQKKALHALLMAGATGSTSYTGALGMISEVGIRQELEDVLGAYDATTTLTATMDSTEDIEREVGALSGRIVQAWQKEERTRLIVELANAEKSGKSERQKEILQQIQALMAEE